MSVWGHNQRKNILWCPWWAVLPVSGLPRGFSESTPLHWVKSADLLREVKSEGECLSTFMNSSAVLITAISSLLAASMWHHAPVCQLMVVDHAHYGRVSRGSVYSIHNWRNKLQTAQTRGDACRTVLPEECETSAIFQLVVYGLVSNSVFFDCPLWHD